MEFHDDGSASITFHGIKNDTDRKGFKCSLPPHSDILLDPVQALRMYLQRTQEFRCQEYSPIFLGLNAPHRAISSATVGNILQAAIDSAGLGGKGYTPKSFRPTGAQAAIDSHTDPKVALQHGRWKNDSVFYEHYVHARPDDDYTDRILH